jgi:hypothetical protein
MSSTLLRLHTLFAVLQTRSELAMTVCLNLKTQQHITCMNKTASHCILPTNVRHQLFLVLIDVFGVQFKYPLRDIG